MGKDDFSKIPNGHRPWEHRVELLFSEGVRKGRITLNKFVEVLSTNPAKIFGMFPARAASPGSDADIVLFDPNKEHTISAITHHMNTDYSAMKRLEADREIQNRYTPGQCGDRRRRMPGGEGVQESTSGGIKVSQLI